MGHSALFTETGGNFNTAMGDLALAALLTGADNTAIGWSAGSELSGGESGNVYIGSGAFGVEGESGVIRIGGAFSGASACFINGIATNSQIWNGVTVCQVTVDGFGHLGVDCVNPDNPRAVPQRPQDQAMLNGKVEKLEATVTQQQKQIEVLTNQLKEQAAQIQKVSAQLEASKPVPQVVNNP